MRVQEVSPKVTGDQEVSARFMRQDNIVFRRTHKHLIYGNHRPMLRVIDDGIRNRLHIVPFNEKFVGEKCDPSMKEKLRGEASQILNWLIEGHQMWMAEGQRLQRCRAVKKETDYYFGSQSTIETWIAERCVEEPNAETRSSVLYRGYTDWKDGRGENPVSQSRWSESMRRFPKRKSNGVIYQGVLLRDVELAEPSPLEISSMVEKFADLL
jgi:putative DNA primase/helicase